MLGFLLGLLIVVALILLAIAYRPVRWILGALAALVVLGILWLVNQDQSARREREAAKHRVGPQAVQFESLTLGNSGYGGYKLLGRARNLSPQYTISSVEMEITIKDCVQQTCDVIGQTTTDVGLDVPPGQVRGVDNYVSFMGVPPFRGALQWEYHVKSVSAH